MDKKAGQLKQDLLRAYQYMVCRVKDAIHKIEEVDSKTIEQALHEAQQTAIALRELGEKEAEAIGEYLQRDLAEAAKVLQKTGQILEDNLKLDADFLESKFWQAFASVADKTLLEAERLNYQLALAPIYNSGEVTGPGNLQCEQCGQIMRFKKVSHIPPCPKCHHGRYFRAAAVASVAKRSHSGKGGEEQT